MWYRPVQKRRLAIALSVLLASLVPAVAPAHAPALPPSTTSSGTNATLAETTSTAFFVPGVPTKMASPDGRLAVELSKDVADEPLRIEYQELSSGLPAGMTLIKRFQLQAFATLHDDAKVTSFAQPVKLKLSFSAQDVRGLDLKSLRFFHLDELNNRWIPLPSDVDLTQGVLVTQTDHFSIFGAQANPAYSLPGRVMDFQVDLNSGAAIASFPLELPGARGAWQPHLELAYHSGTVDEMKTRRDVGSWVGIGWSLDLGHIFYNEEKDEYYLQVESSSRKLVQSDDPMEPDRWYTQPEEPLKVVKTTISTYEAFEVWDAEGTKYTFGGSSSTVRYWDTGLSTVNYRYDLREVLDTNGSKTVITYQQDVWQGTIRSAYPQYMRYNYGTGNARVEVFFSVTCGCINDPEDGYLREDNPQGTAMNPAPPVTENKRLDAIQVNVRDADNTVWLPRTYEFTYITDPAVESADYGGIYYAGTHTLVAVWAGGWGGENLPLANLSLTYEDRQVYFRAPEGDQQVIVAGDNVNNWLHLFNGLGDPLGSFYDQHTNESGPVALEYYHNNSVWNVYNAKAIGEIDRYLLSESDTWSYQNSVTWGQGPIGLGMGKMQGSSGLWWDALWMTRRDARDVQPLDYLDLVIAYEGQSFLLPEGGKPYDVVYDSRGFVYVSDGLNDKIRQFDVAYGPSYGSELSATPLPYSGNPRGLAIDGYTLYVVDITNDEIMWFDISDPTGAPDYQGKFGADYLDNPTGVAARGGFVYVTDSPAEEKVAVFGATGQYLREWNSGQQGGQFEDPKSIVVFDEEAAAGPNPGNPAQLTWPYLKMATNLLTGQTTYTYDALNNLTQVQDTAGNLTTIAYDWLSRKTAMTDPDMGSWSYGYDTNGNLTTQTDAKSQKLQFAYDALDRMTERRHCTAPDCSTYDVLTAYTYDDYDPATGQYGRGQRTGMADPSGSTTYTFDERGRKAREVKVIGTESYPTQFAYDAADRLTAITYPNNEVVTQAYDNRGLPSTLSSDLSSALVSVTLYNTLSLPTQMDLGNGLRSTWEYWGLEHQGTPASEQYGRPYRINTFRLSDNLQHQDLLHAWDTGGNLLTRQDALASETETFTYDFLDRLTSVSGPYAETYAYDALGNLTFKTGQGGYRYGAKPHTVADTDIGVAPTEGLMSYWSMNTETVEGTTVRDAVGAHDASLINGPTIVAGQVGEAVRLDGVDDEVDMDVIPLPAQFSVSFWVKPSVSASQVWVGNEQNGWTPAEGGWMVFSYNANDYVRVYTEDAVAGKDTASAAGSLDIGLWQHITVAFDNGTVEIYKNGGLIKTGAGHPIPTSVYSTFLGKRGDGWGRFNGSLDEIRIYDRDLNAAEVEAIYAAGAGSFTYDANGNMTGRNGQTLTWDAENRLTQVTQGRASWTPSPMTATASGWPRPASSSPRTGWWPTGPWTTRTPPARQHLMQRAMGMTER